MGFDPRSAVLAAKKANCTVKLRLANYGLLFRDGSTGEEAILDDIQAYYEAGKTIILEGLVLNYGIAEVMLSAVQYSNDTLVGICCTCNIVDATTGAHNAIHILLFRSNGVASVMASVQTLNGSNDAG